MWKIRPRTDWLDIGDCPVHASCIFTTPDMAHRVGNYIWGGYFDVQEVMVEDSLLDMETDNK